MAVNLLGMIRICEPLRVAFMPVFAMRAAPVVLWLLLSISQIGQRVWLDEWMRGKLPPY